MSDAIPCARCGDPPDSTLHVPADECEGCKAPHDHHSYRPDPESLQARYTVAVAALRQIVDAAAGIVPVGTALSDAIDSARKIVNGAESEG